MKNLYSRAFWTVSCALLLSGCKSSNEPAIAIVGKSTITVADFRSRLQDTPPAYQQYATTPEGRRQFLNLLIREQVLIADARKAGLQKQKDYRKAVQQFKKKAARDVVDYQNTLLVEMGLARLRAKELAVTDADVRAYYENHINDYQHPIEVQASHILVNTQDEAENVLARLRAGESFETLARAVSMDPQTAARGGRLTPFTRGNLMPEFENAVFALKDGQISGVVKSPFGYHVLKKISQKELPGRSFDQVKEEISKRLQREKFDQWVTQSQTALGVKIDEQALTAVTSANRGPMPGAGASASSQESVQ